MLYDICWVDCGTAIRPVTTGGEAPLENFFPLWKNVLDIV